MIKLSRREEETLKLIAHGFSAEEIACVFFRSTDTVKRTIQNIKSKLSFQKATELTAFYWCRTFGDSFDERRARILAMCAVFLFLLATPSITQRARRFNIRSRNEVEYQHKIAV